jgi:hypothetical protein
MQASQLLVSRACWEEDCKQKRCTAAVICREEQCTYSLMNSDTTIIIPADMCIYGGDTTYTHKCSGSLTWLYYM